MFTDETDLKNEVRQFTGYTSTKVLSNDGLDTAYRNAQRRIRREKSLDVDYIWFNTDNLAAQDALYYWTCLHAKIETGELDSQAIQAGAVDLNTLSSEETSWYRDARRAMQAVKATSIVKSVAPSRTDREYTADTFSREGGSSGGSDDVSL